MVKFLTIIALLLCGAVTSAWVHGVGTSVVVGGDPTIGLLTNSTGGGVNWSDGYANWKEAGLQAVPLYGYIDTVSGTTATLHATNPPGASTYTPSYALGVGQIISGTGVASTTTITAAKNDPSANSLTGVGGVGTYSVACAGGCSAAGSSGSPISMHAKGIPNRCASASFTAPYPPCQASAPLSPTGGSDVNLIQNAVNGCSAGQVILMNAGVFHLSGNSVFISGGTGCTLRGAGPGRQLSTGLNIINGGGTVSSIANACTSAGGTVTTYGVGAFCADSTATQIVRTDQSNSANLEVQVPGNLFSDNEGTAYNLIVDAVQGDTKVILTSTPTGLNAGDLIFIDEVNGHFNGTTVTNYDPISWWSPNDAGDSSFRSYGMRRVGSTIGDMMEVDHVSGTTVYLTDALTYPYHITNASTCPNCAAQIYRFGNPMVKGLGFENMFLWNAVEGNISITNCAYCWAKNIESDWSQNGSIKIVTTFRNEIRDSYMHETPTPISGGGGYLLQIQGGAAENLVENNIMWYGNKVDVMLAAGGGNVLAYNYMDDAFGSTYIDQVEAGINASHLTGTHLTLMEGNYAQNFKGDTYHGNVFFNTLMRNQFSAIRGSSAKTAGNPSPLSPVYPPLNTYSYTDGVGHHNYGDYVGETRSGVDVQAYTRYHNFIGNILGSSGQVPITESGETPEGPFINQVLTSAQYDARNTGKNPAMWQFGEVQDDSGTLCPGSAQYCVPTPNTALPTMTRTANWDFYTNTMTCYDKNAGQGGSTDQGCSGVTVPYSFYIASQTPPAFWPSNTSTYHWPWVDPTTGTTYTLPAKYCFEHGKMPGCI